jgi:hypothetical protein
MPTKATSRRASRTYSWTEANQECLVAEFARLRDLLESGASAKPKPETAEALRLARKHAKHFPQPPAIDRLAEIFSLSGFERDLLLLCTGVVMDSALASQRPSITFALAMGTLDAPHWSALTPSRPLRRFQLIEIEPGRGLTTAHLRIEERILHYLAGINALDTRLASLLEASPHPNWIADEHRAIAAQMADAIPPLADPSESLLLLLSGNDPHGQQDAATIAAEQAGRRLFVLRAEDIPAAGVDSATNSASGFEQFLILWTRESALLDGLLMLQCGTAGLTTTGRRLIERLPAPAIIASRDPLQIDRPFTRFDVNKPHPKEQKLLWQQALGPESKNLNGFLDDLSEQFRLSAHTIHTTGSMKTTSADSLWSACRALARPRLEDFAQRISSSARWDDLVLPGPQKHILHQITTQVRCRMKVYETWGFSSKGRRGLGINALFSGESGTGKTLAAEVLATELSLDLYRIDLSAIMSKYIGETEERLRKVFDSAEEGGVLLLFDEADALFGKRSDVKDSRDRYANIEVAYLLQRMEAFQGLAILTTNLKSSIDRAFHRRLRFTVNFPFPDAAQRAAIWTLAFPAATPTSGLDHEKLSQLKVAGGNIRNIALNAAFLAAAAKRAVEMVDVLEAAKLESHKIERPLSDAETRGWA